MEKQTVSVLKNKFSTIIQPDEYKIIPLTYGQVTIVDNEDFYMVKDICWKFNKTGYAANTTKGSMHRFLLSPPKGNVVDHINGDGLDNRRSNLRICTQKQNSRNSKKKQTGTSSRFKGVSWYKRDSIWTAYIMIDRKRIFIGRFTDEIEAAKAYDTKAKELFGEFSNLNFELP